MHLLDRVFWGVTALFPSVEAPWLDGVPLGDGPIGPDWPARHAAERGLALVAEPDGGIVRDVDAMAGPNVDVRRIAPSLRRFYEHTARFSLGVGTRWRWGSRLGAWAWAMAYGRRWGQLELPVGAAPALGNQVFALGPGGSAGTLWVRCYAGTRRAMYVSRYDVVAVPGEPDPCVRIAFPVPGGAWVVLFRVVLRDDALVLTEDGGKPGGPGLYFVPRGGPARYLSALREEIEVRPTADGAAATHRFWWWGLGFLTLDYALPDAEASSAAEAASGRA